MLVVLVMAVSIAVLCSVASCSGGGRLENAVKRALIEGDTTASRFDSICAIVKQDAKRYSQFVGDDGSVDVTALGAYINEVGSKMRPPMSWDVSRYGLKSLSLSVYFERSGSMTPYDATTGGGQLKKSVNDMINHFPGDGKVSISIVNDDIYAYRGTVEQFVKDRDIYASTREMGNASYTDFELILDKIFKTQGPDNVSILITDLIYSPKGAEEVSAEKIFNEENSLATAVFRRYSKKGAVVHRFVGDYDGKYYPWRGTPFDYRGKRPYFVIVLADAAVLDRMSNDSQYASLLRPEGATDSYRFNQPEQALPANVVPGWKDDAGRYRLSHDEALTLTHCEGDRTTGKMCFTVAANLSRLQKSNDFLNDAGNYSVSSQGGFTLAVRPITQSDITTNNRRYLEGMTHLLTLSGKPDSSRDEVVLTLRNELPGWIDRYSSSDDSSPSSEGFASSTFGLSHFLKGIAAAFQDSGSYAKITIKLTK